MNPQLIAWSHRVRGWLNAAAHLVDLGIRVYVAEIFFRSGLLKIGNWDGTLYLFKNEYRVPLLPPEAAAWLGTFGELAFPPLLALGLAARFAALSLSVVNVMAVISFWHVLGGNEAALMSHFYWGALLLVTLCHGPGMLSIDHWIRRRYVSAPA
ncbi:MAG: DoxX family protein [Betaproteobacteria bacterium]|nr:DoxX family protein [Betaproteobacteria bacterium]